LYISIKFASNRANYYKIDVPKEYCTEFVFPDKCTIYVSFCKELADAKNLCHNDSLGPSSICVTNGTIGYNLGEFTENPFEPSKLYFRRRKIGASAWGVCLCAIISLITIILK